jgi:predicted nucleic acid-binding protein
VALVLDTGVLYGALDTSDHDHPACRDLLEDANEILVIPSFVLVELDYWVRKFAPPDVWLAFCEDIAGGAYSVFSPDSSHLVQMGKLQVKYSSLPLDVTDACVFVTCEALGEQKVATLDHRHFSILRTERGEALGLLP